MDQGRTAVPLFTGATKPTTRPTEFKRNLAVVIGINDYRNGIPALTTAANDARRLATMLQADYHYDPLLLTAEVTKARLVTLFHDQLPAAVAADDRLLLYFAGHGIALDGDDGPTGYLIPQDGVTSDRTTFLSMTEVHGWLDALPCRHLLVILDCCFAGAFRWASTRHLTQVPEILHKERYDRFIQSPAWQVLTSAAYDQTALDLLAGDVKRGLVQNAADCHSPFAHALFQALAGAGDLAPKGQGDGIITATELYLYLRDAVEVRADLEASHQQTPGLWPLRKQRKGEFIFLLPGHELNLPPAPDLTAQANPYRGLKPYERQHAKLFFGREQQIAQLVRAVAAQPLTVVLGASGTGKSSLVKAGLLPALQPTDATGQPLTSEWHLLEPMRPGDAPLRTLEHLLNPTPGQPAPAALQTTGDLAPVILKALATWFAAHPRQRLLLVVDQFEELITQTRTEAARVNFQQVLAQALATHPQQLRIVLTLRSDFEPPFADSPLAPYWQAGRYIVPPLTQAELRAVIEGPAAERVLYFEPPELVDNLIDEVIQTPGALPLLSFTLSEMYMTYVKSDSDNRALTQAHYEALGGVIGSLRIRATQEYAQLPDDAYRATMRRIMLRMVSTEGGELTRRRVPLTELTYPSAAENQRVATVIERLVEARLLVRDSSDLDDDGAADSYVEPAHDALVRAWDQLLGWQREAAFYLPVQRRLTQAARAWKSAGEADKAGLLWNNDPGLPQVLPRIIRQADTLGALLEPGQALWPALEAADLPDWLNEVETAFIRRSVRQRATLRRRVVSITVAVIVALSVTAIIALVQRRSAIVQRNNFASTALAANAQRAIQNGDYDLAIALALQANQIPDPPPLAQNALAAAAYVPGTEVYYKEHSRDVMGVALSPDGRYAVSGSLDQSAVIWDLETHTVTQRLDASQIVSVTSVAYSPTQPQALLGLNNGEIVVWDVSSGAIRQRLQDEAQAITAITYGPDGKQALAGNRTGALTLWDLEKGVALQTLASHDAAIRAVAISPDGMTGLSGADDWRLVLWDLATGAIRQQFEGHSGSIVLAAFGPLPGFVISGSRDRNVAAWRIASGQAEGGFVLDTHTQRIGSIAVAPDQTTVASGGWDGSILLWGSPTRGGLIRAFVGHRAPVISLAYSRDGHHLLSGSKDGVVRYWDLSGPAQVRRLSIEHPLSGGASINPVHTIAVNAARRVALSGSSEAAILWDLDSGAERARLALNRAPALAHKGLVFQVRANDPTVGNRDGDGIESVDMFILDATGQELYHHRESQAVYCAFGGSATSCDAWLFAEHDYRWPTSTGQPGLPVANGPYTLRAVIHAQNGSPTTLEAPIEIYLADSIAPTKLQTSAVLSATGHIAMSGTSGVAVRLVQTAALFDDLASVALSPDGHTALVSADNDLLLWDLTTGEKLLLPRGHTRQVLTIAYSADSQTAWSAAKDGSIIEWDLRQGRQLWSCQLAGTGFWSIAISADGTWALSGAEDASVVLWELPTCQARQRFVGHQDAVYWVALSPDQTIALTGSADRSLILWDLATGQPLRRFEGHTLPVHTVAYSPDGQTVLSGSEDKSVRLWEVKTGAEIFRFEGHSTTVQNLLYLPGGSHLLSRGYDGSLIEWQFPLANLTDLIAWTHENRYVRNLTCDERALYTGDPCQVGK